MSGPVTGLTVFGIPGSPELSETDIATTDTQSISFVEVSTRDIAIPVSTSTDQWNLQADDSAQGEVLDIPTWVTDLGMLGMPSAPDALSSHPGVPNLPIIVSDQQALQWNEAPVDTVWIDTSEAWFISLSAEISAVGVFQSQPLIDTWSITFAGEVSTLSVSNAELDLALNDLWSIMAGDVATMFEDHPDLVDTWSVTAGVESSAIFVNPASTDTWSITYSPDETSGLVQSGAFTVDTTDTWSIMAADQSNLITNLFPSTIDGWNITAVEVSSIIGNATIGVAENWGIGADDTTPADVQRTPMSSDISEQWGISAQTEVGSIANIPQITILAAETWGISGADMSGIFSSLTQPPKGRRVRVGGVKRVIKV